MPLQQQGPETEAESGGERRCYGGKTGRLVEGRRVGRRASMPL